MNRFTAEMRPTLLLAVPIIVGQVSQMLMGVTDSVMIGHAGAVALAASSFGGNVFNIFYLLGIGMALPVSIFVARAKGGMRHEETSEYLRHGVAVCVAFAVLEMTVLGLLATQLHRLGQPPEVLAIVRPFFLLIGASILPVLVYLAFRQYAEAMGRPLIPMAIMLAGVGLNVLLNWVFIYGHLGAPALGLTGAGISTLTSRTLGAAAIVVWVRLDAQTRVAWPQRWLAGWSRRRSMEMLHVGIPAAGMLFFECTAFAFSTVMVGWLGAAPLAAHQIAITCASLSFMFPLGLSIATGIRISSAVGSGERERLRPIGYGSMALGMAMTACFGVAFATVGRPIAELFVHERAVIAIAAQLLVIAALFQLFDGWQVTGAAALRGMTDVRVPALITFLAYWAIALPLGYALGIRGPYGAAGMWVGIAAGLGFAAIFFAVRFTRMTAVKPGLR